MSEEWAVKRLLFVLDRPEDVSVEIKIYPDDIGNLIIGGEDHSPLTDLIEGHELHLETDLSVWRQVRDFLNYALPEDQDPKPPPPPEPVYCNWVRHEEHHKTFWMTGCGARVKHQSGPHCQKCGEIIQRTWMPKP